MKTSADGRRLPAAVVEVRALLVLLLDLHVEGFDVDVGVILVDGAQAVGRVVRVLVGPGRDGSLVVVLRGQDVAAAEGVGEGGIAEVSVAGVAVGGVPDRARLN